MGSWTNQYTENNDRYYPLMCASCPTWLDAQTRNTFGRLGSCPLMGEETYRTDWCHLPDEIALHEEAMRNYTKYEHKRVKKCKITA